METQVNIGQRASWVRRGIATTVVAATSALVSVVPAFAGQIDGEERGKPMSLFTVLGLFVGIPALVIGLVYFLVYVPGAKDKPSTDIATR